MIVLALCPSFQALDSRRKVDKRFIPLTSSALSRSARAGQNRKPSRENQPFLSQFLKTRSAGHRLGHHDQQSRGKQRPMKRQISATFSTRFRITASPKRRGRIRPKRAPPAVCAALNRNKRPCAESPATGTSANSRLNLMRTAREKPSLSGFGVPGVGDLDTLGQQALAPASTPPAEDRAATLPFLFELENRTRRYAVRLLGW